MITTLTGSTPKILEQIAEEKRIRKTDSLVLLFDMGSQFSHLIFQKVAKLGVFCIVADPAKVSAQDVRKIAPNGIIVSGGPASVHSEPPPFDNAIFDLLIPTLGICLGFQMWSKHVGWKVEEADSCEYQASTFTRPRNNNLLFRHWPNMSVVLQSHGDKVTMPDNLKNNVQRLGTTSNAPCAAARYDSLWGVQFHPECTETEHGEKLFKNFLYEICGIKDRFPATDIAAGKIEALRKVVAGKKVLLALSGGSDSSIVAHLLKKALEGNPESELTGVYIKGIDRPDDEANVLEFFGNHPWIHLTILDATDQFLQALKGVTTAKEKRLAMRGVYKKILEEMIQGLSIDYIAQGTLYTDLVESGLGYATGARRAQIKLHHNTNLGFSVPELMPLDDCVKDNARDIGRQIGVPEELLTRQPFPGPGMLVRIEGEITEEKLAITRKSDGIMTEELKASGLYEKIWQSGVRLTVSQHTKSAGDDAGTGALLFWFAVSSTNGFTARAYPVPFDVQCRIADRIGNEVRGIGAVAYRYSGKPPSTIEAE